MLGDGAAGFAKERQKTVTRIIQPLVFATVTIALTLPVQAAGSLTRTFVSSTGSDSNPCTITAPCATFAAAYAATVPNGIVAALDPGKYGPLTITAGVTINGNRWAAITAPASGNGITVNAGPNDNVTLTGLEIDGAGAGTGANGIVLNSAGSLMVTDCILRNFANTGAADGNGILIQPTSGTLTFAITTTTISRIFGWGIHYIPSGAPNANGVIDHVVMTDGANISVNMENTSGTLVAAISNSITSNGSAISISNLGSSSTIRVSIDNVSASGNDISIVANGTPNIVMGRSVITGNDTGIFNRTSPNTFYTYGDNRISLNGIDIDGALNTTFSLQ
jgi:hypothetical protein